MSRPLLQRSRSVVVCAGVYRRSFPLFTTLVRRKSRNPLLMAAVSNATTEEQLSAQQGSTGFSKSCGMIEMQDFGVECIDLELFLSNYGAEEDIRGLEKNLLESACSKEAAPPTSTACHVMTPLHPVLPTAVLPSVFPAGTPSQCCDVSTAPVDPSAFTLAGFLQQQQPQEDMDDETTSKEDIKIDFDVTPHDLALARLGDQEFDPRKNKLKEEDLRPQPMVKKARKKFVKDEGKTDVYWERRKKNNTAAKRSRDARRAKENQIVMRAAFLEKENEALRQTIARMKQELNDTRKGASLRSKSDSASLQDENSRLRLALAKMSEVLKCL